MKKVLLSLMLLALAVCASTSVASGSDNIKVSPEQAVRFAESWLAANGDAFGVGGDMVRTVVEYERVYLMLLSPSGWMSLPKINDRNFRPLSFGGGKLRPEMFEESLWGKLGGASEGVVVYENAESDKPRQRIYRGLEDFPYDNKMEIDVRELRETGEHRFDGTISNDVFAMRFNSDYGRDKNTYVLTGNGGSDIYDCSRMTASVLIRIERRSNDEKNAILIGYMIIGLPQGVKPGIIKTI